MRRKTGLSRVLNVSMVNLNLFLGLFTERFRFSRNKEYFECLLECAVRNKSMEALYNLFDGLCPDTLFYHLNKYALEDMVDFCNSLLELSFKLISSSLRPGKVILAVDCNDVVTWGVKDRWVHKILGKKAVGASRVHKYATITIVGDIRVTLACLPVMKEDGYDKVVRDLVEIARRMVKIDMVLLDRGFYRLNVINTLEEMDIKYIIHARKCKSMDRKFRESGSEVFSNLHIMNKDQKNQKIINVYFKADKKYEYLIMTSNKKVEGEKEIISLFDDYRKRWDIENTYKEKNNFHVKTSSKKHQYRYLVYCLGHLLANLLQLVRKKNNIRFTADQMKIFIIEMLKGLKKVLKISKKHLIILE
jgi:putative transposase